MPYICGTKKTVAHRSHSQCGTSILQNESAKDCNSNRNKIGRTERLNAQRSYQLPVLTAANPVGPACHVQSKVGVVAAAA